MHTQPQVDSIFSPRALLKQNSFFSILTGVYVFCWFTQIGKRIQFFDQIRFEFLLGTFLTIISLYALSQTSKRTPPSKLGFITILLILYYGIFSVASYNQDLSWTTYIDRVIKFSLLSLFIYASVDNIHKLAFILLCYFLASAKCGQEGFWGWLSGNLVWQNQGIPRLHGAIDMYGHPNSFSGFAVCLLPFIYCLFPVMNKYMKAALLVLLLFALVIILFTGSRTGYIATVVFFLYASVKYFKKNFFVFMILIIPTAAITINLLPDAYKGRFESIFTQEDQEGGSTTARKQILYDGIDVFLAHPLGVGVGAFPTVRESMFGRSQNTHNLYLEVLTNTGFIGLIIFFAFVRRLMSVNKELITIHTTLDDPNAKFLSALSNAVIGYLWARIFLGLFGMDMYEIYWWLALGLTLANHKLTMIALKEKTRAT